MASVDTRYGLPISPEMTGNFFRGMSLGDFYGKERPNPRIVPISQEQFLRWGSTPPNDDERRIRSEEEREFARSHGIEEIGGMEGSRDRGSFLLESRTYRPITEWLPHHGERELILQLAQSVAGEGRKPLILDAACGSGAITKILAADGRAETVGVDLLLDKKGANNLPSVRGADLRHADLWDVIDEFSPQFPPHIQKERQELLKRLRERIQDDPVFRHLSIFSASAQIGEPEVMNEEVARLQEISQQRTSESSVDLVICSFMPTTADLTIPIREGISPKAIVYIRPTSGMSGAGDYYKTEWDEEDPDDAFTFRDGEDDLAPVRVNSNTIISYNPGINYRTVTRWNTPWQNSWVRKHKSWGYVFDAEATVQLRNDVDLNPVMKPHVERYDLDIQLERGFANQAEKGREFLNGIQEAKQTLFDLK